MESHSFSEPQLVIGGEMTRTAVGNDATTAVVAGSHDGGDRHRHPEEATVGDSEPPSALLLTWRVDVMRHGVAEPIGSIEVNSGTLPPRKNRSGKVVWKLPDDPDQVPKFGVHEQKRLWELFKEQKKQRRKQQRGHSGANAETNASSAGDDEGNSGVGTTTGPAFIEKTRNTNRTDESALVVDPEARSEPQRTSSPRAFDQNVNSAVPDASGTPSPRTRPRPQVTPPPPGFGNATAESLESLTIDDDASSSSFPTHAPLAETPARRHGVPNVPSPPGIGGVTPRHSPSFIPRSPNARVPDSPMVSLASPANGNRRGNHGQPPAAFRPEPPAARAFAVSPLDGGPFPSDLAAAVARTFLQLISAPPGGPSDDGVSEWLSHYVPQARSTLIMGTAQAVANTSEERHKQWQSLSSSSASALSPASSPTSASYVKLWECHGWVAQELVDDDDGDDRTRTAGRVDSPHTRRHRVLVVLTGRTMQQHPLSFHLSLILQRVQRPPQQQQPSDPRHPSSALAAYRISNEILALALIP